MDWVTPPRIEDGVMTREFVVGAQGRTVPGVLWTPAAAQAPLPLVLIGHGGSQHKTEASIVELARIFASRHGFAAAAIDGPVHGARRGDGLSGVKVREEFVALWTQGGSVETMLEDWRAAIDALLDLPQIDARAVAWHGVSMGTAYGLPLVAAERRIRTAVFGMWSTDYPNSARLANDAPQVVCPVLFLMKWNDEFFTREGQIDLFDKLGSGQKWLKAYMGGHVPLAGQELADIEEFLVRQIRAITAG